MANFADLVKRQRESGAGVTKSLTSAAGQQLLEKVDIRNYLFNRKGTMTALFPGLKGYQAGANKTDKISSQGGSGLATEQITQLSESIDKLGAQISIVAKNSYSLPMMSRDMNVMRQNMVKLVKLSGGTASTKADMFFTRAKDREASYESQFGRKSTSPTAVNAGQPEKEGFFAGLMKGGFAALLPLLVKAGLVAGLAAAIKEYIDNPEFRETINKGVKAIFDTILEFMKAHWKETLIALALLFPKTTLTIVGEGLRLLAKVLGATARGGGLVTLFRGLIGVLSGPVGVVALLGLMAYGLSEWIENNTEWGKKAKENREAQPKDLSTIEDPDSKIDLRKPTKAIKDMTMDEAEMEAERQAVTRANDLFIKGGMTIRDANGKLTDEYKKVLFTYRKEAREEINKEREGQPGLQIQGLKRKGQTVSVAPAAAGNSPVPAPNDEDDHDHGEMAPANAPEMIKLAQIKSKTGATATVNAEYAGKFQALIDYLDSINYPIKSIQGYSDRNIRGGNAKSIHAYGAAIDINPATNPMGKNLITDLPPAAIEYAKKLGLGWGGDWSTKKDPMHFSAATNEGGTLLAMGPGNRSGSPIVASSGNARPSGAVIASASSAVASGNASGAAASGNQTVNVVNNQTVAQASAAIPASAYDTDLIRYLLRPVT